MSQSRSRLPRLFFAFTLATGLFLVASAPAATALEISIDAWSGPSMPEGSPATTNVTVSYSCGDALPAPLGGPITVTATLGEGANGTLSFDGGEIEPDPPVPEAGCTPGDDVETNFSMSYLADRNEPAGSEVTITIDAVADGEVAPDDAQETTNVRIGPYVDITFVALADQFQVIGGDVVTVEIEMRSDSNVEVMAMPDIAVPEGWSRPDIAPPRLASPLDGGPGNVTMSFDVVVPEEAEGQHTVVFSSWAHSTDETAAETDTVEIPLTFDVTSLAQVQQEAEEGPAPVALGVILAVLAAVGWSRHRRW